MEIFYPNMGIFGNIAKIVLVLRWSYFSPEFYECYTTTLPIYLHAYEMKET